MNRIIRILIVAILLLSANIRLNAVPPLATIQKAKEAVENARYVLPMQAGNGIILTQVDYDSKTYSLVYRYHYTVPVEVPSKGTINETKKGMIHLTKANPDSEEMMLLNDGITFDYNYYSEDGTFLFSVKITPDDVK